MKSNPSVKIMSNNEENLKFLDRLSNMFHKIFEASHLIYTIFFLIFIVIISFMSFTVNISDYVLFFATLTSLMFIILMLVGVFNKTESYLFSKEPNRYFHKLMAIAISLGLSFIILIFYFIFGSSTQILVEFLGWDILLPVVYVIIYFGWNLAQIFFLRITFEDIAIKFDDKLLKSNRELAQNRNISILFAGIVVFLTLLIQISSNFGFMTLFEPLNSTDSLDPLYAFFAWNVFMYLLIGILAYRLFQLQRLSIENETPNVFSSMFHILIWIIIWYRSFSFIYSFRSVESNLGVDVMRVLTDVFLMILTSFLVLRGLGAKIYRLKLFNQNNLPFFLFAFTILYVEGQVIMIIGGGSFSGLYTSRTQINLVNNLLVLGVTIIFYWWYSKVTLEKKNLIPKSLFSHNDVAEILTSFKDYLENSGALEKNKVDDREIKHFMENKKISTNAEKT